MKSSEINRSLDNLFGGGETTYLVLRSEGRIMIESYLQITCNGCGDVEPDSVPFTTYKSLRKEMRGYGWRNYGKLDYCSVCVANGKARDRYSIFGAKPPNKSL